MNSNGGRTWAARRSGGPKALRDSLGSQRDRDGLIVAIVAPVKSASTQQQVVNCWWIPLFRDKFDS